MRILVYEWASGGGVLGLEGALPPSMLREGMAMARAVGEDFAKLSGAQVTLLRDVRVMDLAATGCEVLSVDSAAMRDDLLQEQFAMSDAVLLIAPETDGHLLRVVRSAEQSGARLISPNGEWIEIASDKVATNQRLKAAGVPTPEGVVLDEDESLPSTFNYPAVLKPIDGAGSEDTYLIGGPHDTAPPYAWPRLLEPFHAGQPASVAVLASPAGATPLMPCRQHLSNDGRLRYQGGSGPLPAALANRVKSLALAAVAALPNTTGYVGVDLVLGTNPTGAEDVVIEINPRLTTSYAGLRYAAQSNLAQAMLDCREGRAAVDFGDRAIQFGTDGLVTFA